MSRLRGGYLRAASLFMRAGELPLL